MIAPPGLTRTLPVRGLYAVPDLTGRIMSANALEEFRSLFSEASSMHKGYARRFQERGIAGHQMHRSVIVECGGESIEVDLLTDLFAAPVTREFRPNRLNHGFISGLSA
jgi:hypothetical protein